MGYNYLINFAMTKFKPAFKSQNNNAQQGEYHIEIDAATGRAVVHVTITETTAIKLPEVVDVVASDPPKEIPDKS